MADTGTLHDAFIDELRDTYDAENQVLYSKEKRPFVPVAKSGALLPEVREVIAQIAKHGLTLETGQGIWLATTRTSPATSKAAPAANAIRSLAMITGVSATLSAVSITPPESSRIPDNPPERIRMP